MKRIISGMGGRALPEQNRQTPSSGSHWPSAIPCSHVAGLSIRPSAHWSFHRGRQRHARPALLQSTLNLAKPRQSAPDGRRPAIARARLKPTNRTRRPNQPPDGRKIPWRELLICCSRLLTKPKSSFRYA